MNSSFRRVRDFLEKQTKENSLQPLSSVHISPHLIVKLTRMVIGHFVRIIKVGMHLTDSNRAMTSRIYLRGSA